MRTAKKRLNVEVPVDLFERFKAAAKEEGLTLREWVSRALWERYIKIADLGTEGFEPTDAEKSGRPPDAYIVRRDFMLKILGAIPKDELAEVFADVILEDDQSPNLFPKNR